VQSLDHLLNELSSAGVSYKVRQKYHSSATSSSSSASASLSFHGLSVKVDASVSLSDLLSITGVLNAWPVRIIERVTSDLIEAAGIEAAELYALAGSKKSPSKWTATAAEAAAYRHDTFGPHVQAGIDAVHAQGHLGKGVKIGVIDSGVDYTHPILGGCFGKGCHISFGYAFAGDDYDGTNTPVPSADPYTNCSTHGTHVTGTVGALANPFNFWGAAPLATLGHYRVFGCTESATDDVLVAAIMRAYEDGCDIISMSIVSGGGWLKASPSEVLIDELTAKGVVFSIAAGNDRAEGLFFSEEPADTVDGLSAASTDVLYLPSYSMTVSDGTAALPYMAALPFTLNGTYPIYFPVTNSSTGSDACKALPASTPNLAGKVVVVQRGGCTFDVKYANIAAKNGTVVILYNTATTLTPPQLNPDSTGIAYVGAARNQDGRALLAAYNKAGGNLTARFPYGPLVPGVTDTISGGIMSTFSNYGPTNELYLQPSLAAPGKAILSTVPLNLGGLLIDQGTSMATPLIAGASALILGARASEKLTPAQIKSLFMTTATPIPVGLADNTTYAATILQGAGSINVAAALAARTLISPYNFLLNDTAYLNGTQTLYLTNRNLYPVTYTFSHIAAQGIAAYADGASSDVLPSTSPATVTNAKVTTVKYSRKSVTVLPYKTGSVEVTITPPSLTAAERGQFPIYSGFIGIEGTFGRLTETYSVPYFGLAAAMYDMPVLDTTDTINGPGYAYPFVINDDIVYAATNFTTDSGPTVLFRLAAGTRYLTLDLVASDVVYNTTVPTTNSENSMRKRGLYVPDAKRGLLKDLARLRDHHKKASSTRSSSVPAATATASAARKYTDTPTIGNILTYNLAPRDYLLDYGTNGFTDSEILFNGTYAAAGSGASAVVELDKEYRVLLRAQKITGDPSLESSYESWLSYPIAFTA